MNRRQPAVKLSGHGWRLIVTLLVVASLLTSAPAFGSAAEEPAGDLTPVVQDRDPVTEEAAAAPCVTPTEVVVEVTLEATPGDPTTVPAEAETSDPEPTSCSESTPETVTPEPTTPAADATPSVTPTPELSPPLAESTFEPSMPAEEYISGPVTPEPNVALPSDQPPDGSAIVVPVPTPDGNSIGGIGTETGAVAAPADPVQEDVPLENGPLPDDDPMLAGISPSVDGMQLVDDPLLAGLEPESTVEAIVIEQQPDSFLASAPAANAKKPKAGVTADTISPDGTVVAGGQALYYFRLVNTANNTEHFWIEAETAGAGWTTAVYSQDGTRLLTDRQTLKGGESKTVLIIVTSPTTALPGEVVTTTVNAVDNN